MDAQSTFTLQSSDSTINTYNSNFEDELRRRGVRLLDEESAKQPENLDAFRAAILKEREMKR